MNYDLNQCKKCKTMKHLSICERCFEDEKARAERNNKCMLIAEKLLREEQGKTEKEKKKRGAYNADEK